MTAPQLVITTNIINAPTYTDFWDALENYIITPVRYNCTWFLHSKRIIIIIIMFNSITSTWEKNSTSLPRSNDKVITYFTNAQ